MARQRNRGDEGGTAAARRLPDRPAIGGCGCVVCGVKGCMAVCTGIEFRVPARQWRYAERTIWLLWHDAFEWHDIMSLERIDHMFVCPARSPYARVTTAGIQAIRRGCGFRRCPDGMHVVAVVNRLPCICSFVGNYEWRCFVCDAACIGIGPGGSSLAIAVKRGRCHAAAIVQTRSGMWRRC
jgi:hypothetical protein